MLLNDNFFATPLNFFRGRSIASRKPLSCFASYASYAPTFCFLCQGLKPRALPSIYANSVFPTYCPSFPLSIPPCQAPPPRYHNHHGLLKLLLHGPKPSQRTLAQGILTLSPCRIRVQLAQRRLLRPAEEGFEISLASFALVVAAVVGEVAAKVFGQGHGQTQ